MESESNDKPIKLIWDFRGPAGEKTAEHYVIHLKEYTNNKKLTFDILGSQAINDMHSIAFLVVTASEMPQVRDDLKPHRGELSTEET